MMHSVTGWNGRVCYRVREVILVQCSSALRLCSNKVKKTQQKLI